MNKPHIYLADLIHNYIHSMESYYVVPLNIGYVGAYLKESLKDSIKIKLFKYPDKLAEELKMRPPDIMGFSFYTWNEELVLHFAKTIKEANPTTLIVLGGPNIDTTLSCLSEFLKKHKYIDYYIPYEGEEVFECLVKVYLEIGNIYKVKQTEVKGAATYSDGLNYPLENKKTIRKDHINYPSPYLTGIMDEFLKDPYLYPLFETNRGCPFKCTYCTWGSSVRNHMKKWPLDQVLDEFEYVAKHGVNQERWIFADSNFGIYERDLQIAKRICSISKRNSSIKSVLVWNSKNTTERNIEIAEILGNLNGFLVALQTLDKEVLFNIKRNNIKEDTYVGLINYFKAKEADIETDILIGLPGETFHKHITTLRKCFDYGIRYIRGMNIRLLSGSEMASEDSKNKYDIKTKFRVIRDSYGYYMGKLIIDSEEGVCSTSTMSENEMLKLRIIHFFIWLFWNQRILQPIMLAGRSYGINVIDQILSLVEAGDAVSPQYNRMLQSYMDEAVGEWYETKEDIGKHYTQDMESLRNFNFLNYKYSSRILFNEDIFSGIVSFLVNYILLRKTSNDEKIDLNGIKEYTIQRVCLNLNQIDEYREVILNKNAYDYLVNEKIINQKATHENVGGKSHVAIKLQLKDRNYLISKVKYYKKENSINYDKCVTPNFLANLIYTH